MTRGGHHNFVMVEAIVGAAKCVGCSSLVKCRSVSMVDELVGGV